MSKIEKENFKYTFLWLISKFHHRYIIYIKYPTEKSIKKYKKGLIFLIFMPLLNF